MIDIKTIIHVDTVSFDTEMMTYLNDGWSVLHIQVLVDLQQTPFKQCFVCTFQRANWKKERKE